MKNIILFIFLLLLISAMQYKTESNKISYYSFGDSVNNLINYRYNTLIRYFTKINANARNTFFYLKLDKTPRGNSTFSILNCDSVSNKMITMNCYHYYKISNATSIPVVTYYDILFNPKLTFSNIDRRRRVVNGTNDTNEITIFYDHEPKYEFDNEGKLIK